MCSFNMNQNTTVLTHYKVDISVLVPKNYYDGEISDCSYFYLQC